MFKPPRKPRPKLIRDIHEASSCTGKEGLTFEIARQVGKRMKISFYHCRYCDMWHVGNGRKTMK